MSESDGFLRNAYTLENVEATKGLYRDWAASYEREVKENGYATPPRCAEALLSFIDDVNAPILDIGCGTGLSGEALKAAGFTAIDGTDFSEEMLEIAKEKGVYRQLLRGDLNNPIPAEPGTYAHIAAIGVISPGHAPAETLADCLTILPAGGCIVVSLNDHALAESQYLAMINELVDCGSARILFHEYGDHLPKIGLKSSVYVLQKA